MRLKLLASLLLATPLVGAETNPPPSSPASTNMPARSSREIGEGKVLKVYAAKDGAAEFRAYVVEWHGQEVIVGDMFAESNFKEGDTLKFIVARLPVRRTGKEMLQFQIVPASAAVPVFKPQPRAVQNPAHRMVFFECRDGELFCVEKDNLEAQVANARPGAELGNANYTVNTTMLAAGLMSLEPRANSHGDKVGDLNNPNSQFQKVLQQLNRQQDIVIFIVRDNSVELADKGRQIAEAAGFTANTQPLAKDRPLKFSTTSVHPRIP